MVFDWIRKRNIADKLTKLDKDSKDVMPRFRHSISLLDSIIIKENRLPSRMKLKLGNHCHHHKLEKGKIINNIRIELIILRKKYNSAILKIRLKAILDNIKRINVADENFTSGKTSFPEIKNKLYSAIGKIKSELETIKTISKSYYAICVDNPKKIKRGYFFEVLKEFLSDFDSFIEAIDYDIEEMKEKFA